MRRQSLPTRSTVRREICLVGVRRKEPQPAWENVVSLLKLDGGVFSRQTKERQVPVRRTNMFKISKNVKK